MTRSILHYLPPRKIVSLTMSKYFRFFFFLFPTRVTKWKVQFANIPQNKKKNANSSANRRKEERNSVNANIWMINFMQFSSTMSTISRVAPIVLNKVFFRQNHKVSAFILIEKFCFCTVLLLFFLSVSPCIEAASWNTIKIGFWFIFLAFRLEACTSAQHPVQKKTDDEILFSCVFKNLCAAVF